MCFKKKKLNTLLLMTILNTKLDTNIRVIIQYFGSNT